MNKLSVAGATLALLATAGVVMAAGPSPSPAASSPAPSPAATTTPAAPAAPAASWNASLAPVQISGSATVSQLADGKGQLTLTVNGLLNETGWVVTVYQGTLDRPLWRDRIALKQGDDIQVVAPDTIRVLLTKAEMAAFMKAQTSPGVVVFVSNGTRLSAGTFAAS
jgi:hypothetical protein